MHNQSFEQLKPFAMETKKNKKFDLEPKRKIFFFYGLIISMLVVLFAFNNAKEVESYDLSTTTLNPSDVEDIYLPPSTSIPKPPPPPPPIKIFNTIVIVENTSELPEPDFTFLEPDAPIPEPIRIVEKEPEDVIQFFPEQLPTFPGGMQSLNSWLSRNIKYPDTAAKIGVSGRVYLNFIVDKDGSISNVTVIRSPDKLLEEEATRLIASMPKWKPGLQNGKPVRVSYNIFVTFQLN